MSLNFSGKHVLVTGGAMSIGKDIAKQFAESGAMLTIFDYNEKALAETGKEFSEAGYRVNTILVDVSDQDTVIDCVSKTEAVSPVDILINNAGICPVTPFLNIERSEWQLVLDVNLSGAFYVAQAVCRYMAKR